MTDYLIRTGKDGMVTDLMELGEEEHESCLSDKCYDCEQLEAAMLAIIGSMRDEMVLMGRRISALENKPKPICGGFITNPGLLRI